ncbi:MAG TPA: tRNA (guanosine(37)-N1)-methyltransferase TrmD, partial [Acidimicrobiia bacterium]|nr:tRNA (guanosine(37)-N1)-methyltransferase TrmD [Acidimicrobiia bacterium]
MRSPPPYPQWVRITVITLFPEFFEAPLSVGIVGRALEGGRATVEAVDLRQFGLGGYRQVDDAPFGGGPGMVMMIE